MLSYLLHKNFLTKGFFHCLIFTTCLPKLRQMYTFCELCFVAKSIKIWGGVNIKMVAIISIQNELSDSPNENVVGKISDTIYE